MKSKTTRVTAEARTPVGGGQAAQRPSDEQVRAWIAEAAYYRAEKRGFSPGLESEDWAAAEAEVLARTRAGQRAA